MTIHISRSQASAPKSQDAAENASPFKCIHGFALSLSCASCDMDAQKHHDGLQEWQRLQNEKIALMGRVETEVGLLLKQNEALRASLAEMVTIYWGEGDGLSPPPACIQKAQKALGDRP